MARLHLNADCGEQGLDHADDAALIALVDAVNIACGGHAGDAASARRLADAAAGRGLLATLHLSYPDRAGFGRRPSAPGWPALAAALDLQRAVLPELSSCKLHGALYHAAQHDADLATRLVEWFAERGIDTLLSLADGLLARCAEAAGLRVLHEGFADRTYERGAQGIRLRDRCHADAVLAPDALADRLRALASGKPLSDRAGRTLDLRCDSWCVHGDTPGAIAVLRAFRAWEAARC